MEDPLTIHLDDRAVKFTPDGRVAVFDAIGAVTGSDRPRAIWKDLRDTYPEVRAFCDHYLFSGARSVPVVDSEGWGRILPLLVTYVSNEE
jgi:hypothetical protein